MNQTFAAFQYRNYRLWFIGQLASLVGTWMQITAQGYLVFELTHSSVYLGYVGFAFGIPSLLTMYGGVVSDRVSKRKVLIIVQNIMMLLAFGLAALTFLKIVRPWHIVGMAFLLGIANAFDAPARQSFVLEMVDREYLTNAIALNSMMFNLARAAGPAAAGMAYAIWGPGWCFTLNGISFIAVIIALLLMKIEVRPPREIQSSVIADSKEGFLYAIRHPIIRLLLILVIFTSIFGLGYSTLIPAWAVSVLHGDVSTVGFLQSAHGVGSLLGALTVAAYGNFARKGRMLMTGMFVFPLLLLVFSSVHWTAFSLLALIGTGWGFMLVFNLANALVQTSVPDEMRGRVMGLYVMGFFGAMPIGALLAGFVAEKVGDPLTVGAEAVVMLLCAIWVFVKHPEIRDV